MSTNNPVDSFKALPKFDQGILATGFLGFIASFFPWYGYSGATVGGVHYGGGSVTAWHSYSTLAVLLLIAATALAAVVLFARDSLPDLPVGAAWIVAGLSVLGTFLELLRLLTVHHGDGLGIKWGGYVLAILMIANSVFAVMAANASGQTAPWAGRGSAGGTTPPPAA